MTYEKAYKMFRFLEKIQKTDNCWYWNGTIQSSGYGSICIKFKRYRAHRLSYILFKGNIPKNMFVCHTCDIKHCVNPDHLWLGTLQDNVNDMMNKGRHARVSKEKHSQCKLRTNDISKIRKLHNHGWNYKKLAKHYNISTGYIRSICKFRCRLDW